MGFTEVWEDDPPRYHANNFHKTRLELEEYLLETKSYSQNEIGQHMTHYVDKLERQWGYMFGPYLEEKILAWVTLFRFFVITFFYKVATSNRTP